MLIYLLASSPTQTASPQPTAGLFSYDWWADIGVGAVTGVASVIVSVVALWIAERSRQLARAATEAALRSNAIAKRANEHQEAEARRTQELEDRKDRQEFADRFLVALDRLTEELLTDPQLWSRPIDQVGDNALYALSALIFESSAREWKELPHRQTMELVLSGARAGGGVVKMQTGRNAAHAVIREWASNPGRAQAMAAFMKENTDAKLAAG